MTIEHKLVYITWSTEDVIKVWPYLTVPQALRILAKAAEEHDASMGVNWETLYLIKKRFDYFCDAENVAKVRALSPGRRLFKDVMNDLTFVARYKEGGFRVRDLGRMEVPSIKDRTRKSFMSAVYEVLRADKNSAKPVFQKVGWYYQLKGE